jgi:methylthioribose-1-phosphate isomerase
VALPTPTIDWSVRDGVAEIPIEDRSGDEVRFLSGRLASGDIDRVDLLPPGASTANPSFDVTPARLVTGLITERGVVPATETGMRLLRD